MKREDVEREIRSILELDDEDLAGMTLDDFGVLENELPRIVKEIEDTFHVDVSELTLDVDVDDVIDALTMRSPK